MIEIKNVSKSYNGKKKALDNVSFTKKGGTASRSISTDALGRNIQFSTTERSLI